MKFILLMPLLLISVTMGQTPEPADLDAPVAVLEFKWYRDRKPLSAAESGRSTPARAVIPENKKFQREAREQLTTGAIDPNTFTVDGRSAALEKISQESRKNPTKAIDGFTYHAKLRNQSKGPIDVIFLDFQFIELANPSNRVHRQFLCAAQIKPQEKIDLKAFSSSGPSDVISIGSLSNETDELFEQKVNINRVEFADGAIIQRKDWNFAALKESIGRAVSEPWGAERCRGI